MADHERPAHSSSPPRMQHHDNSPETSLSVSDRSLRSIQSAPSLSSTLSSSAVSGPSFSFNNPDLNLRIVRDDSLDDLDDRIRDASIAEEEDKDEGEDTVRILPPDITITPALDRPELKQADSEQTVSASNYLGVNVVEPDARRMSEYGAHADDDEASISSETEELRRTLFYRPSTDPVSVAAQTEPDLDAVSAHSPSLIDFVFVPDGPSRPPRPPSLNLSEAEELKPKSVELVRPAMGHSRSSSRDRLGAFLHSKRMSLGTQPLSIKCKPTEVHIERTVEVHPRPRARTISGGSLAMEMDRSVWEDDTEELSTAWGLVRKWLDDKRASTSTAHSSKKRESWQPTKSFSLGSTITAFRASPTAATFRDSAFLNPAEPTFEMCDTSSPALRESSVLGLHETAALGSSSTVCENQANTSGSRASFQTANASFPTAESFQTAGSQPIPSFQSLAGSRRSFQSRRLGPRASLASSVSSVPESPTATRARTVTFESRPGSRLLIVPQRESKPLFSEPEPRRSEAGSSRLPSPPSSPSPTPRALTTTARSLHNPTYPSLHKRLGSLVTHNSPPSPLWNAGPSSPVRSQAPSTPVRNYSPASSRWSPLYPSSPLGLGMNMDSVYRSDVRPVSGFTESSYYGRRPESGTTWADSQRGLLIPPPAKSVRIVDSPERRIRLPTPPPSAPRARTRTPSMSSYARTVRGREVEYEGGLTPGRWFALGFMLGPWCWLIGGWMLEATVLDAEKGTAEADRWIRRCRVAAVVSGVAVLATMVVAIAYAVVGAR